MINALLCDFDGTIVNTIPLYLAAYNVTLRTLGFNFSDEEIVSRCFGKTEETICRELEIPEKTAEFKKTYFLEVEKFSDKAALFPDAYDVLSSFKEKNIKLAVITFQYKWYIEKMLHKFELEKLFDSVISFDDITHPKPAPDAVLKVCSFFNLNPSSALVIGDTKSDIMMGKHAGAETALFVPTEHALIYNVDRLKESKPQYTVDSWNKVYKLL